MKKVVFYFLLQLTILAAIAQPKQFKVLIITSTQGWHHESLHYGVVALKQMAQKHFFDADVWQDPGSFTDEKLKQYDAVIFLNTTGNIFDSAQQKVMERFIESGKGYVGVHSASDTEYGWPWYTQLVGRMFYVHPAIQTAKLKIADNSFPGLQGFANDKEWTDEWYTFGPEQSTDLHYVLAVDETTYDAKADWGPKKSGGMGKFHPIAWYHNFDGGRAFYTALGHLPSVYSDDAFLDHLYAGILWAATGKK